MKTDRNFKIPSLILVAALSAGLGCVSPASAQQLRLVPWYIVDLNTRKATSFDTVGGHINDSGQTAGTTNFHAFITGPNGMGMTDLGTLGGGYSSAEGINASGQVTGDSATTAGGLHAFITGPNGLGMTDLGTLGGDYSRAGGINDSGQVVGASWTTAGSNHAFITGPNGLGMTDLGTLGGDSVATGINAAGQVAGSSSTIDGEDHAFITGPNGAGMTDLDSVVKPPAGFTFGLVSGINNHGQLVVSAILASPIPEPAPYVLLLAGLILVGFMVRLNKLVNANFDDPPFSIS